MVTDLHKFQGFLCDVFGWDGYDSVRRDGNIELTLSPRLGQSIYGLDGQNISATFVFRWESGDFERLDLQVRK